MLKCADEASPLSVPEEAILEAAAWFLQRSSGGNALSPVDNIASPNSGRSDLAYVKRDRSGLAVARFHRQENFADFFLKAAAYQCWLKECLALTETMLHRAIGLDVYLISYDFPSVGSCMWKVISKISELIFVSYRILNIEEQETPVVNFELLDAVHRKVNRLDAAGNHDTATGEGVSNEQPPAVFGLSSAEIDEFTRLKVRHL